MNRLYVVIDQDDEKELVYKPTAYTWSLEAFAGQGSFPMWTFTYGNNEIIVYGGALSKMPMGEELEEIEHRILVTLNLLSD